MSVSEPAMTAEPVTTAPVAAPRDRARAAVTSVANLLRGCRRPDLDRRVAAAGDRLATTSCTVLVVGEFKKGKSSLVNALTRTTACPVDDDIATAKPIEVRRAPAPTASVVLRPAHPDGDPVVRPIDPAEVRSYVLEPVSAPDAADVVAVRIGVANAALPEGLVVIDTPGVGGLGSEHSAVTVAALPGADVVLFVTDASQELTASELDVLRTARQLCPTVVVVETKTDFYPAWRKIVELDTAHLRRHGLDCQVLATSAAVRDRAIRSGNRTLNRESGYAQLMELVTKTLFRASEHRAVDQILAELGDVVDHLETQLRSELQAIDDPESSAELVRALDAATERHRTFAGSQPRWAQLLNDSMADLQSDTEHDLRRRFRELVRLAEDAIDGLDPAKSWEQLEPWLVQSATAHVVKNFALLHEQSALLAERVAAHFDADTDAESVVARLDIEDPSGLAARDELHPSLRIEKPSLISLTHSTIRNSYSSMFMLTGLAGTATVTLATPVSLVLGVAIGQRAVREELRRQLLQRRAQAKQAARKYAEDVQFVAQKDSRDALRTVQRQLRDHFRARADELASAAAATRDATDRALRSSKQQREHRRTEITATLAKLPAVRARIAAPVPAS